MKNILLYLRAKYKTHQQHSNFLLQLQSISGLAVKPFQYTFIKCTPLKILAQQLKA